MSVEASLVEGRFQGFRIVEIKPPDAWRGVDLRVGDVVTRINDMPIERPQQAYDAFVSFRPLCQVEGRVPKPRLARVPSQ